MQMYLLCQKPHQERCNGSWIWHKWMNSYLNFKATDWPKYGESSRIVLANGRWKADSQCWVNVDRHALDHPSKRCLFMPSIGGKLGKVCRNACSRIAEPRQVATGIEAEPRTLFIPSPFKIYVLCEGTSFSRQMCSNCGWKWGSRVSHYLISPMVDIIYQSLHGRQRDSAWDSKVEWKTLILSLVAIGEECRV